MTVVKFSILALLAGGFCTLLGVGIWMGPQETSCNAQTAGVTTVAVAAPCQGRCDATDAVATKAPCVKSDACSGDACALAGCTSGSCDLVSAPASPEQTPCETGCPTSQFASTPQLPAANPYAVSGMCENGLCFGPPPSCPPGMPCPPTPYPTWGPAPVNAIAPCVSPDGAPVYSHPYPVAPAFVASAVPAPASPAYSYEEARGSFPSYDELMEAYFEEREARHEAQLEALQAQMELQLEAHEAIAKAQHDAELAQIKAEAAIQIADLERAMREQEGLLRHVAAGTISQEALQTIVAKCDANATGETLPVSTSADACKCEKRCGETCKCGKEGESCACTTCKCEGCACPGCEKTVSIKTTCTTGECKACATACKTCPTAACAKSCEACVTCTKECDACALAAKSLELIGVDFDCQGKNCTIVVEGKAQACPNGQCTLTAEALEFIELVAEGQQGGCKIVVGQKTAECPTGGCKTGNCESEHAAAVATPADPFVCEKDGCELKFEKVDGMPVLTKLPYVGQLFKNVAPVEETKEETAPAEPAR